MPKDIEEVTARLLSLRPGQSCVVNVRRPDRQISTARKREPERDWRVQSVDGGKVVTRVR